MGGILDRSSDFYAPGAGVLSASFWCWLPALGLIPGSPDFLHKVDELHQPPFPAASYVLVEFVDTLLKKYPDLADNPDETVWADGPLKRDISGQFIDMGIQWSGYEQAIPFVVLTAHRFGLNCYDPQVSRFYPASPSK